MTKRQSEFEKLVLTAQMAGIKPAKWMWDNKGGQFLMAVIQDKYNHQPAFKKVGKSISKAIKDQDPALALACREFQVQLPEMIEFLEWKVRHAKEKESASL